MNRANRRVLLPPKSKAGASGESDIEALRVAAGFAALAGSLENAVSLALALRRSRLAKLTMPAGEVVSITPSGAMSWKDVKMALMLARYALQRYGIVHPTGPQLQAALCGGEAVAPNGRLIGFRGVLRMRAEGMNWGRIAAERFLRPEAMSGRLEQALAECVRA